ncbi:MAG: DUF4870 domain-containing protein [Halohasta sp.]
MSDTSNQDTGLAIVAHIAGFVTSILGPLLIYLLADDEFAKRNAANALNWQLMVVIYGIIAGVLSLLVIGFALIPLILLLNLVFCVVAAIKASKGEAWSYPITYDFV